MQISQLKEYFELGIVAGFTAERQPLAGGWALLVKGTEGRSWTLETKLGKVRIFASLDTLVGQLDQVAGTVSQCRFSTLGLLER